MTPSLFVSAAFLLALFLVPFGVYAYALGRLERPLPAFLASSALLVALMALALAVAARAPWP